MKSHHLFVFFALFLTVNAVPAKKQISLSDENRFDSDRVSVPTAIHPARQQHHAPTSVRDKTIFVSPVKRVTPTTTSSSYDTPKSSDGPPTGIGGCVSCSIENFHLVNEYRASRGLTRLSWSNTLSNIAEDWSKHMYHTKIFEHSHYPYWENIASSNNLHTWNTAANGFFKGWRNSPDQDQNMRLSSHVCMGVGIYGDGTLLYATQIFSNYCP